MLNGWINDNLAGGHAVCFDEDDDDGDMFNISSTLDTDRIDGH